MSRSRRPFSNITKARHLTSLILTLPLAFTPQPLFQTTVKSKSVDILIGLVSDSLFFSPESTIQIVLATAHPAKFSMAVNRALGGVEGFEFDHDVLPNEFRNFLTGERRVIDIDLPDPVLVKETIEKVASGEMR